MRASLRRMSLPHADACPCCGQLAHMGSARAALFCAIELVHAMARCGRASPAAAFLASLSSAFLRAAAASAARFASRSAVFLRSCSFSCAAFSASCDRPLIRTFQEQQWAKMQRLMPTAGKQLCSCDGS